MTSDGEPSMPLEVDLAVLSEREREVLDAALGGESVRDLADRLSLTEATVRSHLAHIYDQLGVSGRVELLARMNGHHVRRERRTSEPPSGSRRGWKMPATIAAVLVLLVVLFAWWRPDLPPKIDGDALMQFANSGQIAAIDIRGTEASLTTTDGRRLRADRLDDALVVAVETAVADHGGKASASPPDPLIPWFLILGATAVAPFALLAILGLLAVRWIRSHPRPPAMPSAAG